VSDGVRNEMRKEKRKEEVKVVLFLSTLAATHPRATTGEEKRRTYRCSQEVCSGLLLVYGAHLSCSKYQEESPIGQSAPRGFLK